MKIQVRVKLLAECDVDIWIERETDEIVVDLSLDEEHEAIEKGGTHPTWWVESTRVMEE